MAFDRGSIREGMVVRSSDGEKLGKVIRLGDDRFEIEKGFFFPEDYVAGYAEISDIRNGEIHLGSTKSMLKEGWSADRAATGRRTTGERIGEQEVRVPLAEEELSVNKELRESGEVRIHKDVVTETKEVPVTVRKEEVRVERVPATGERATDIGATGESTVVVPVREEVVEVTKRPVVKEEIRVTKEVEQEQRNLRETVRREEAEVEDTSRRTEPGIERGAGYSAGGMREEDRPLTGGTSDKDKYGI